ncbi:N-acetyltransferase [Streptomyces inusitatus]|uniref:N-acetyltransferase n=1 Tax=Streptomyces inusitatus TaxID=68221 RepID=A0A918UMK7_9ACTN|nr:GNAT family N-acetyltransferase [Streptomyces inusitatus]GGZ22585.1 N-acetyltransferase [Streptomyces inusitatus]
MSHARLAKPEDAEELIRLRQVMLDSYWGKGGDTDWQPLALPALRARIAERPDELGAYVVDRPGGGLAACAVGSVGYRIGGPGNPHGLGGYLFSVATDPDMRRRGHSRACVEGLLGWFRERGVSQVNLRASPEAEPLYASLGFVRTPDPAMRLVL